MRQRCFFAIIFLFLFSSLVKTYLITKERPLFSCSIFESWGAKGGEEKKLLAKRFLGFSSVAADCYWLYFLQLDHIGCKLSADFVFNCADIITYLDPHFNVVYRFASIGLSLGFKRYDLATKLLEKAVVVSSFNRDDWRVNFYLGHNYHFFLQDQKRAVHYIKLASQQQKACGVFLKQDRGVPPDFIKKWGGRLANVNLG